MHNNMFAIFHRTEYNHRFMPVKQEILEQIQHAVVPPLVSRVIIIFFPTTIVGVWWGQRCNWRANLAVGRRHATGGGRLLFCSDLQNQFCFSYIILYYIIFYYITLFYIILYFILFYFIYILFYFIIFYYIKFHYTILN